MDKNAFATRLLDEVDRRGLTLAGIARDAGVSYEQLKKIIQKVRAGKPATTNVEDATALARALGTTVESMLSDVCPSAEQGALEQVASTSLHVLVNVWDVTASAGNGAVVPAYESVAYQLAFPPDYLRSITSTPPEKLQIISVKGRSMLTTLDEDDVVMIDRTKTHVGYDGIFVIRIDDTLHVKRIARSSTRGLVRIISDNKAEFPEFERAMAEIEVLGRVIWAGKRM